MPRRQLAKARKLLTDVQLTAFIHAAAAEGSTLSAGILANELTAGHTLEALLGDATDARDEEYFLSTELKVERISARTFRITFCITCGNDSLSVGDGATWRVSFRACGKVQRLVNEVQWIA